MKRMEEEAFLFASGISILRMPKAKDPEIQRLFSNSGPGVL
jgi:hypothetical protein